MSSPSLRRAVLSALALAFLWTHVLVSHVSATVYDNLEQGFLFDWSGDQSPPIPVANQCDSLNITWGRRSATGPDPQAPFFLQVYTSTFVVPFVIPAGATPSGDGFRFSWPLPFNPGTLFQICMFANNGVTGGCQDIYTVLPAPGSKPPVCQNLTYPQGALDVQAKVAGNIMSQAGWIPQCSDISVTPVNGTPPYTYTIAPALRPSINFTSNTMDTQSWTVSLPFGLPFWLSVQDSKGWSWTNGPLHASNGSTSCLVPTQSASSSSSRRLSAGGAAGLAFGMLIIGAIVGTIGAWLLLRRSVGPGEKSRSFLAGAVMGGLPLLRKTSELSSTYDYNIDPFVAQTRSFQYSGSVDTISRQKQQQSATSTHEPNSDTYSLSGIGSSTTPTVGATSPTASTPSASAGHVYVVHHDGGPPPVTLFTPDGTKIVELPPNYDASAALLTPRPAPSPPVPDGQRRHPQALPGKNRRSPSGSNTRRPS